MATVKQAEKAVGELEKEKARCQSRLEALQAERETARVDRLGPIAAEGAEARETLRVIGERLKLARLDLADAQKKANESKIGQLRKEEQKANAQVIVARDALDKALQVLQGIHVELSYCGAGPAWGDSCLFTAVKQSQHADRLRESLSKM